MSSRVTGGVEVGTVINSMSMSGGSGRVLKELLRLSQGADNVKGIFS